MKIEKISAREVLDSRGNPTVECEIRLKNGRAVSAIVPSGASTGTHEAIELRDGGKRYLGKGVLGAVSNINTKIAKKISGMDFAKQESIDKALLELDGTQNKGRLGANAMLAVSLAAARAGAQGAGMELYEYVARLVGNKPMQLPVPFCNIINGGMHAGNGLAIQEFMVAPIGAKSFSEGVRMVVEIYGALRADLKEKFGKAAVNVGDEGGFAPPLKETSQALEMVRSAIDEVGYAREVRMAIDAAASEFYKDGGYSLDGKEFDAGELSDYYADLAEKYALASIEDPFAEDDWKAFSGFNKKMGGKLQIVADDLTATNMERLKKAVFMECANCLLLKVNQIGTLSESLDAARYSFKNNWNVMVSHRSGETEDAFIADLGVALACRQIKLGAPARGERTAKYNRLLRIEELLGGKARYGWIQMNLG
ncbi:MAG: phosphopyruvate hydratase [Candidatus Micrarchaeota archaeon]